jgi:hypothetical protein
MPNAFSVTTKSLPSIRTSEASFTEEGLSAEADGTEGFKRQVGDRSRDLLCSGSERFHQLDSLTVLGGEGQ